MHATNYCTAAQSLNYSSSRGKYKAGIAETIKESPKAFLKYVHSQLKTKAEIGILNNPDGSTSVKKF